MISPPQSSGDTRRDERRQAMLDAAESLFMERGFDRTSLAAIVERSGGSLATLYDLFESKQGLLKAVMERNREVKLAGLMAEVESGTTCCESLKKLAMRFHDFLSSPTAVAMMRIMIAESLRDPVFARQFYCRGRDEVTQEVATLLSRWANAGRAAIDDPSEAAALFMATTLSDTQINAMVPAEGRTCRSIEHDRLAWRVEHFCKGFGIR